MPKDSCSFRFSVEEDGNAAVWILGCAVLTQSASGHFIFNPVSVSVSYVHERCRFFVLHIHAGKTENDAEK